MTTPQIGTNTISACAKTVIGTAGTCLEAALNSRVPTTMNTAPCSKARAMSSPAGTSGLLRATVTMVHTTIINRP